MSQEWKLVPVEPTGEMLSEIHLLESFTGQALTARYKAMLAAAPVPPAGDLPERMDAPSRDEYELECYWAAAMEQAKAHNDCLDACLPIIARLQAENAALQQRLNVADQRVDQLQSESFEALYNAAIEERDAAQSELTKARELLKECVDCVRYGDEFDLPVTTMKRVDDLLAHQSAPAAAPLDHVHGDVLPPVGSTVQIQLGDSGWFDHTVTGYYAWPNHGLDKNVHRVFVRVKDSSGTPNARLLADIRLPTPSAQQ